MLWLASDSGDKDVVIFTFVTAHLSDATACNMPACTAAHHWHDSRCPTGLKAADYAPNVLLDYRDTAPEANKSDNWSQYTVKVV